MLPPGLMREEPLVVRLGKPESHSALDPAMVADFTDDFRRDSQDPQLRSIVLTGGGKSFCVGADLKWLASQPDPGTAVAELVAVYHDAIRAIREAPVPVIAAVNGPAAGGGLSLAMVADYRIASSNATFTAAYFRLGLPPDGGASAFLVTTIGAARTMELLLTNRTLAPDEALAWGLVNEVVPPEILLERACEVAGRFGGLPAETLLTTRRLLDTATSHTLSAQLDAEEAAMRAAAQRPEFKQALESFLSRQST